MQNSLYRELREAIPIVDAAIYKIIRLTGGFHVDCKDKTCEKSFVAFFVRSGSARVSKA